MDRLHRQSDAKRRAGVVVIAIDQRAAVGFDDQLAERQADAAAADFGRLAELEHLRAPFRRHARAGVVDIDGDGIAILVGATRISPPSGCASMALRKRLSKVWRRRVASPWNGQGARALVPWR